MPTCEGGTQDCRHPTCVVHTCIDAVVAEAFQEGIDVTTKIGRLSQQFFFSALGKNGTTTKEPPLINDESYLSK